MTPKTKRAVGRSRARVAEYDADIAALVRKLPTSAVSAAEGDSASAENTSDKLPEASTANWRDHVSEEHMDDPRVAEMLKKLSEPNSDTVDEAEFLRWYSKAFADAITDNPAAAQEPAPAGSADSEGATCSDADNIGSDAAGSEPNEGTHTATTSVTESSDTANNKNVGTNVSALFNAHSQPPRPQTGLLNYALN